MEVDDVTVLLPLADIHPSNKPQIQLQGTQQVEIEHV
jgi:hypothetical protein